MYNRMYTADVGERPLLNEQQEPREYKPETLTGQPAEYPPSQPQVGYPLQPQHQSSSSTATTGVIQQPQTQFVVQGPRDWSTGLCSCFDDFGVCKYTKL